MSESPRGFALGPRVALGLLATLASAGLLTGCPGVSSPGPATDLFSDFSLGELVDRDDPALVPGAAMTFSAGHSSSVVDGRTVHHATHTADLRVRPGAEDELHRRLHAAVRREVDDRGLTVHTLKDEIATHHLVIGYAGGGASGWIDLSGVRCDGDAYRVEVVMTESDPLREDPVPGATLASESGSAPEARSATTEGDGIDATV